MLHAHLGAHTKSQLCHQIHSQRWSLPAKTTTRLINCARLHAVLSEPLSLMRVPSGALNDRRRFESPNNNVTLLRENFRFGWGAQRNINAANKWRRATWPNPHDDRLRATAGRARVALLRRRLPGRMRSTRSDVELEGAQGNAHV